MIGLFLLRFERPEQAERRIAGAAIGAHLAALADKAGAHDIRIVTANDVPLTAKAWDDVRRACPSARFDGYEGAPAISVSGRMLVAPEALRDFAESNAETLIWRGRPIARKAAAPGSGTLVLEDDEAVSCDDRNAAERWLMKRTSKPGDGIVSRRINRPISQTVSRYLLRIDGIRPWHMTVVTALFAMAMIIALVSKGYGALIAAGLLFHAASVIDGVDGEIARASYRSSAAGATLDTSVDMATNVSFYLGFTLAMARLYGFRVATLGGVTLGIALLGLGIMAWLARRTGQHGFDFLKRFYTTRFATGFPRVIIDSFITIMSRDFFAFAWALLILFRAPLVITYGLAFFSLLWVVLMLVAAPALLRESGEPASGRLALGRGSS